MCDGISIIVSSYNRPDLLKQSMESLYKKTEYEPIEIIIVDDGSNVKHMKKIEDLRYSCYVDNVIFMPLNLNPRAPDTAWELGFLNSDSITYPYVYFTADDFIYRTGWLSILMEMITSDWAKEHNVRIVSGFNHWVMPGWNESEMLMLANELYVSKDRSVEGYAWSWASTWLIEKSWFSSIGRFVNNLKKETIPPGRENDFEFIMRAKTKEFGFVFGVTKESYVQHIAENSTLHNFFPGAKDSALYKNQMAIGWGFKDA